jgi:hypothetical protein
MINLSALKNKPESSKVENTTIEISIISTIKITEQQVWKSSKS